MGGEMNKIELLQTLSDKYKKSPAQIILRWNIQNNIVTIPKSVSPERIRENFNIWDFELTNAEIASINALDKHERLGPDPDVFV